jgi:hypothetical protein
MRSSRIGLLIFLIGMWLILNPDAAKAQANNGDFGIGVLLGEPTGASVKSWLSDKTAFDVGVAWSLAGRNEALHLNSDFLLHSWFEQNDQLAFYYGLGGRIIFADDAQAGVRVPLGLNYVFESIPFDLFLEAVPILDLTPEIEFAGNGAVGIRYYI